MKGAGGIGLVFKGLERDSLPADVNVHTRQNIYLAALQLADFLLCSNVSTEQGWPARMGYLDRNRFIHIARCTYLFP